MAARWAEGEAQCAVVRVLVTLEVADRDRQFDNLLSTKSPTTCHHMRSPVAQRATIPQPSPSGWGTFMRIPRGLKGRDTRPTKCRNRCLESSSIWYLAPRTGAGPFCCHPNGITSVSCSDIGQYRMSIAAGRWGRGSRSFVLRVVANAGDRRYRRNGEDQFVQVDQVQGHDVGAIPLAIWVCGVFGRPVAGGYSSSLYSQPSRTSSESNVPGRISKAA
jgi:hypothetical protein